MAEALLSQRNHQPESTAMTAATRPLGQDLTVMGLVGIAHFASHFYQLVIPSLFLFLRAAFDVPFTSLGLLATLFYLASGLAQTPAGFMVDRFGARAVLLAGLTLLSLSTLASALATQFWMFYPLAMLAGLGNSVFHPADLSILTSKIDPQRLGRAYGSHALFGNLGWAAAPVLMVGVAGLSDWRSALVVAGGIGIAIVVLILAFGRDLAEEPAPRAAEPAGAATGKLAGNLRLLFSPSIISCFMYFAFLAMALIGVQTIGPSALSELYGLDVRTAALALTVFLIASAGGVLIGAVAADRTQRHDLIAICGMGTAAVVMLPVAAGLAPGWLALLALGAAGAASGMTTPSRDMLVRAATPKGASGRVFGFVYSGLDLGSTLMPVTLGALMDLHRADAVFFSVSGLLACTMATVFIVKSNAQAAAGRVRT